MYRYTYVLETQFHMHKAAVSGLVKKLSSRSVQVGPKHTPTDLLAQRLVLLTQQYTALLKIIVLHMD